MARGKVYVTAMTNRVASADSVTERRRARRFTVDWDVVVRGKDALGANLDKAGSLRDLSSRGAFLSIPAQLKVGMRFEVLIRMPLEPERWMSFPAEIVRIDKGQCGAGAATKFLTVRPQLRSSPLAGSGGILEMHRSSSSDESI
jgi:hypothetical protein